MSAVNAQPTRSIDAVGDRDRLGDVGLDAAFVAGGSGESKAAVEVSGLTKAFQRRSGAQVPALNDIHLRVEEDEFVVLLGPSGCGKTTLLRCIAGLEHPDGGTIKIGGRTVFSGATRTDLPPNQRALNMMFQSYALWPHMTVAQNVAFPLRTRGVSRRDAAVHVGAVLEQIGIAELERSYPGQLSGGQQQRVALARALVGGDRLILFDEPLSNVDAKVRERLRVELLEMQHRLGFAVLYVTHDQQEAMELADRVVVLERGGIAQAAAPGVVYERPASRYVANFIGTTNELVGTVERRDDRFVVRTEIGPLACSVGAEELSVGDAVVCIWRPERCELVMHDADPDISSNTWRGSVRASMMAGPYTTVIVDVDGHPLRVVLMGGSAPGVDSTVTVRVGPEHVMVMSTSEDN